LEILKHGQEVFQIAADSIESPAHNHLEPSASCLEEEAVETRPPILRTTHLIGVFSIDFPTPRLTIPT